MFKASKWMRTLRQETVFKDAVYEITKHPSKDGHAIWVKVQTYEPKQGPAWQYLVLSPDVAQSLAQRLLDVTA